MQRHTVIPNIVFCSWIFRTFVASPCMDYFQYIIGVGVQPIRCRKTNLTQVESISFSRACSWLRVLDWDSYWFMQVFSLLRLTTSFALLLSGKSSKYILGTPSQNHLSMLIHRQTSLRESSFNFMSASSGKFPTQTIFLSGDEYLARASKKLFKAWFL